MTNITKTPMLPPVTAAVVQKQEAPRANQETPVKFEVANPVKSSKESQAQFQQEDAIQKSEHFFRPAPHTGSNVTVTQELDSNGRVVEQVPVRKIVEAYTESKKG